MLIKQIDFFWILLCVACKCKKQKGEKNFKINKEKKILTSVIIIKKYSSKTKCSDHSKNLFDKNINIIFLFFSFFCFIKSLSGNALPLKTIEPQTVLFQLYTIPISILPLIRVEPIEMDLQMWYLLNNWARSHIHLLQTKIPPPFLGSKYRFPKQYQWK